MTTGIRGQGQHGQSVALFALLIVVVFGALALVVDVGFAYGDRRYQQDAADAAAMAATRLISTRQHSDAQVVAEINRLAGLNNGAIDWAARPPWYVDSGRNLISRVGNGTIPGNAAGVAVVSGTVRTGFFSWVIGQPLIPVTALSVSIWQEVTTPGVGGLVPLSAPLDYIKTQQGCSGLSFANIANPPDGCVVELKLQDSQLHKDYGGYAGPANFKGIVDFDPVSDHTKCQDSPSDPYGTRCWCQNGLDGHLPVPRDLPIVDGDLGGNVGPYLLELISTEPKTLDSSGNEYGIIYVPIYGSWNPATPDSVKIEGFAAFIIYADDLRHGQARVTGRLTAITVPASQWNSGGSGGSGGSTTMVAHAIRLVPPDGVVVPFCDGAYCPTPVPTPAPTETPAPTSAPTFTGVPATVTPIVPTMTSLPATFTSVPATNTTVPPTNTIVPPTNTKAPATVTPVPATPMPVCEVNKQNKCQNPHGTCVCPPGSN